MANSTPGVQTFNTAFPLEMQIKNQFQSEELAILYITDRIDSAAASQQVEFSFTQSGNTAYTLKGFNKIAPSGSPGIPTPSTGLVCTPTDSGFTPNDTQYNLALVFRPGTLSDQVTNALSTTIYKAITTALPDNPCVVNGPIVRTSDGAKIWYCAFKNNITTSSTWNLSFMLKGITAAAGVGTRSTQMECLFANVLQNSSSSTLQFRRSYHLDIINHEGHTYAPVFFGVQGNNALLNKPGTQNQFEIYFESIGRAPIQFSSETQIIFSFPSDDPESGYMHFGKSDAVSIYAMTAPSPDPGILLTASVPTPLPGANNGDSDIYNIQTTFALNSNAITYPFSGKSVSIDMLTSLTQEILNSYISIASNIGGPSQCGCIVSATSFNQDNWESELLQWVKDGDASGIGISLQNVCVPPSTLDININSSNYNWNSGGFKNLFYDSDFVSFMTTNYVSLCTDLGNGAGNTKLIAMEDAYNYFWVKYQTSLYEQQVSNLTGNSKNLPVKFSLLNFKFTNIQISGNDGAVNLGIKIQNLPGYWDTNFQVPLIKGTSRLGSSLVLPSGSATIGKDLTVTGTSTLTGAVTASNDLTVTGDSTLTGAVTASNDLTVTGNSTLNGGATIDGGADVSGGFLTTDFNNKTPPTPSANGGLSVAWNKSGGYAEVNFYNNYCTPTKKDGPVTAFEFLTYLKKKWQTLMTITGNGRIQDITGDVTPVGSIIAYGGTAAPTGWLLCNGQSIPTGPSYKELSTLLGVSNVPDLRSRFIVGAGQGTGLSSYDVNDQAGEETHQLEVDEMPSHSHTYQYQASSNTGGSNPATNQTSTGLMGAPETGSTGSGEAHNNLPPYCALTYIIKY